MPASSKTYTSFAVAGATGGSSEISAGLGNYIARALLKVNKKRPIRVVVLTRAQSADNAAAKELIALGAEVKTVDYDSDASLAAALQGIEVVISNLAGGGFAKQPALAQAAKKAGVQLFVPSEFGSPTGNVDESSPLYGKRALHGLLQSIQLPYTLFWTGPFADWVKLFFSVKDAELAIVGEGKTPISFTSRADVGSFVAEALTTLPPAELANATFPIQGSSTPLLPLARRFAAKSIPPLEIIHESKADAYAKIATGDFLSWLKASLDDGGANLGALDVPLANDKVPGWSEKAKKVEEFL